MGDERFELKEMQKLEGHTDKVLSLAWNPLSGTDGIPAIFASCSSDKTIRIWRRNPNTSTFECLAYTYAHAYVETISGVHAGTGRSCSWSPDGDFLAIPGYNGTTYIWDRIDDVFNNVCMPEGEQDEVVSVSWSPVGAQFATCSRNYFRIWEVQAHLEYDCDEEFKNPQKMSNWSNGTHSRIFCSYVAVMILFWFLQNMTMCSGILLKLWNRTMDTCLDYARYRLMQLETKWLPLVKIFP